MILNQIKLILDGDLAIHTHYRNASFHRLIPFIKISMGTIYSSHHNSNGIRAYNMDFSLDLLTELWFQDTLLYKKYQRTEEKMNEQNQNHTTNPGEQK